MGYQYTCNKFESFYRWQKADVHIIYLNKILGWTGNEVMGNREWETGNLFNGESHKMKNL